MINKKPFVVGVLVLICLSLSAVPALAQLQIDSDPGSSIRTRQELQQLLELYQTVLESPAYSDAVKRATRAHAEQVRRRLRDGDFALGDRIVLYVQGEPELPDTVAVQSGPRISLPLFGDVSLQGVLRSEVEERLTEALAQYINDPVVQARPLMRVSVLGAVGRPGFFVVPADMLLSEMLMVAGGPGRGSKLDEMRIERGASVLMRGQELEEAVRQGLSLDQLNLQAGDQLVVPEDSGGLWGRIGIVTGVLSGIAIFIVRVRR